MADLFWPVTLGIPAVVLVVALVLIVYTVGHVKKGNLFADTTYDGIIQTLHASGKLKKVA